jgi:hypothetical protein
MRGRRRLETQLVDDLLARLQPYKTLGVMCRRCRRLVTEEEAQDSQWSYWGGGYSGGAYACCPECAEHEYEHGYLVSETGERVDG